MPLAAATLLVAPGCNVTLTALKWSGTSVTAGSLVAATTVRMIAGGVVCAAAEAASAVAASHSIAVVLQRMMASRLNDDRGTIRASRAACRGLVGLAEPPRNVDRFSAVPLLAADRDDHIAAADLRNRCRRAG